MPPSHTAFEPLKSRPLSRCGLRYRWPEVQVDWLILLRTVLAHSTTLRTIWTRRVYRHALSGRQRGLGGLQQPDLCLQP
jgi:hypothetical protein